nr:AAA family ATPase [Fervidobacterium sp.]
MIELLHINEYVYLKDVDIYFSSGLNVITGETGTGKSLLLDVIGAFLDYQNLRSDTFSADMVVDLDSDVVSGEVELSTGQHIFTVERKNKRLFYKIDGKLSSRDVVQD